jgi:hypothetical protein
LPLYDIEAIPQLNAHIYAENENWAGIGKTLGEGFNYSPDVTIATTAAGAIPYYSRLRTVDMLGINDKWVIRHGVYNCSRPGHQRWATLSYLIRRKVDIIISHPVMLPTQVRIHKIPLQKYYLVGEGEKIPSNLRAVAIPMGPNYKLMVIYIPGNPVVDEAIRRNGWTVHSGRISG